MDQNEKEYLERPDGGTVIGAGSFLLCVGIIAMFVVVNAETVNTFTISLAIAQIGIGLGVLLIALGYVVRAIWFLPGREIEKQVIASSNAAVSETCEFCDQKVFAPNKPCPKIPSERLTKIASQIDNEQCRTYCIKNGYLEEEQTDD
ncbi:hypothetical protein [Sphingorhabdus sp. Alg239-R122]|uniref:hypothetical protein n=1 Tax=Sphingorhabdus sp. Alg239-R122 TaxID=2305989 RepID=UPI0013DB7DF4|nr:hypothetical protein [Sphingorhabdus sp. Alg239-R122]